MSAEITLEKQQDSAAITSAPNEGDIAPGIDTTTKQAPVVFSKSETIPLGFTNKLLRKAAYGLGIASFLCTGLAGIGKKNPLAIAGGFGSAAVNIVSAIVPEHDNPLPDSPIIKQAVQSLYKPGDNALLFNRSWSFITWALTAAGGLYEGNRSDFLRGAFAVSTSAVDVAGLIRQDKREKETLKALSEGKKPHDDSTILEKIFANRWVSLTGSSIRAGMNLQSAFHNNSVNRTRLTGGIFNILSTMALIGDNYIMEQKIKQTNADRAR